MKKVATLAVAVLFGTSMSAAFAQSSGNGDKQPTDMKGMHGDMPQHSHDKPAKEAAGKKPVDKQAKAVKEMPGGMPEHAHDKK